MYVKDITTIPPYTSYQIKSSISIIVHSTILNYSPVDMSSLKKKRVVKKSTTGIVKKVNVAKVNNHEFRLLDFTFCDSKPMDQKDGDSEDNKDDDDSEDCGYNEDDNDFANEGGQQYTPKESKDDKFFRIQIFGINEKGETCCIFVDDYQPFFFIKVEDDWTVRIKEKFIIHLKNKISQSMPNKEYYHDSITESKLIKRNELYGFDAGKLHKFVQVKFRNVAVMNKVKNLFYFQPPDSNQRKLSKHGYIYGKYRLFLYEAQIPPLLRYFHLNEISPSGWITIRNATLCEVPEGIKKTTCTYEYVAPCDDVVPLNEKETQVPYKICSFDIEASSSHGDFPVPVKTYKKLAITLLEFYDSETADSKEVTKANLKKVIKSAFQFDDLPGIELVYPKKRPSMKQLNGMIEEWMKPKIEIEIENGEVKGTSTSSYSIEDMFMQMSESNYDQSANGNEENDDNDNDDGNNVLAKPSYKKRSILRKTSRQESRDCMDPHQLLHDSSIKREVKMDLLSVHFANSGFPELEGDKVTFIGSTFLRYGESAPYLNNCLVLNTCDNLDNINNSEIETFSTEKQLLLAWTRLIARENPDIIVGYNIFGFDYAFMFQRSLQNKCAESFLQLSRNKEELCGKWADGPKGSKVLTIEESSTKVASGEYNLHYVKMSGRLQVDLYNHFRKNENLTSYKLDYVSGYFIGDNVKSIEYVEEENVTRVVSKNLTGLEVGNFINFEEISHSTDTYKEGKKFEVLQIRKENCSFDIGGKEEPNMKKQVRWGLAKDDVTPQDIFRLTNEGPKERAIIAKYCIQDCNLVHHLTNKIDAITGFIEMAKICSVPINFLVMRGQGIKLTSYIAKKCREKNALMPVLEKPEFDDGYEGAIVLDPKCNLYLDNPVACVDYSSLYPSSMISENLSHDSKVWTKEYDLLGNLLRTTGEYDKEKGAFTYDNLPEYEYVDIEYDTFRWEKNHRGKSEKVLSGKKLCRFAQFPNGKKAIMPSILEELLSSRKATRKMIPLQTDEFMKNVLDKRQLSYKLTANSLYGQCGAKTSTFYEKDVAASTTATGRKLLTYGKRVIEESYGDIIVNTDCHGKVHSNAEYVYGDSVASQTPVYVRVNGNIIICEISKLAEKCGKDKDIWVTCAEPGKQGKEFCELEDNVETWTEKGWTRLYRVIRHKLACHKKMIRILTHTGMVDVTNDHSLLDENGSEVSPDEVDIGSLLLHKTIDIGSLMCSTSDAETDKIEVCKAKIFGFFFGDGSCGSYKCPRGTKSSWALNNANDIILEKYLGLCNTAYPDFEWKIYDTIESSGVFKITFNSPGYGSKKRFIEQYRDIMYSEECKIIPDFILNGSREIREAFWEGMYDADGDKDANGYVRIDQKNQVSAAHICFLANSIDYKTSINTRKDKMNIFRITATKRSQRRIGGAIKKMQYLETADINYVYDLTTDNHHFAAGVGNMIVHNTDSVFFTFNLKTLDGEDIRGQKALDITIELAQEAGELATMFLKKPHDLEYEKTFMPFCLLSKKRYVGMLYELDPNKGKRKSMGIVLKRRDNAPIVKDVYGGIIDILMKEKDVEKAIEFLHTCLQNIIDEKYPLDKLIITKSLRSDYKNPQQIAHKVLADRMGKRDSGNKPSSGDRIPFVYIETKNKNALQGDKIEHPSFIIKNNIRPNYAFYITNQIMKPVQQVFALVLLDIKSFQRKKNNFIIKMDTLRNTLMDEPTKLANKITDLKNKEVKALLFDKYLRDTENTKQNLQNITKFFCKM